MPVSSVSADAMEVLGGHRDGAECAALPMRSKGEIPCGFIVLKAAVNRPAAEIEQECISLIREKIGLVIVSKLAITVTRLPKTRSARSFGAP